MSDEFLTVAEAADKLRLSTYNVSLLCRDGRLPAYKPAGRWLIAPADLEAFVLAASNQKPESGAA